MVAPPPYSIHSVADSVASIDQGEDPWFAFGCFLHDWWRYAVDRRQDLISIQPAPTTTAEGKRWAAFFAAAVEELCSRTSFPCPAWIHKQDYKLEHPWFHSPQLSQRDWLLSTTPSLEAEVVHLVRPGPPKFGSIRRGISSFSMMKAITYMFVQPGCDVTSLSSAIFHLLDP